MKGSWFVIGSNGMGTHSVDANSHMMLSPNFRGQVPLFGPMSRDRAAGIVATYPCQYCLAGRFDVETAFPACDIPRNARALAKAGL